MRISLCFEAMLQSLFGNAGRTTHVLIRAVGATANESWRRGGGGEGGVLTNRDRNYVEYTAEPIIISSYM